MATTSIESETLKEHLAQSADPEIVEKLLTYFCVSLDL